MIKDTIVPFYEHYPTCSVSSHRISTFDKVLYSTKFSTCWTVLAKDCGAKEEPNFAILAKKLRPESEMKKLKIIVRSHVLEFFPETKHYDSIKIRVNDRFFTPDTFEPIMEHGHTIVSVEKLGKYVKISFPETGLFVFFDGYAVNTKISQFYRNVVCGLCGNADQETDMEFYSPEKKYLRDVREFFKSYTIRDSECSMPELESICPTPECEYEPFYFDNDDIDTPIEEVTKESPIPSTKVIEHGSKLCFSKVPVPRCPRHTYPSEFKPNKKIVYSCFPRTSFEAQEYLRRAEKMEYVSEVRKMSSSFSEVEEIPKKCMEFEGY